MVKDILTDKENIMIIQEGDFVVDLSEEQHLEAILISEKGQWKESPQVGVGIVSRVNSSGLIDGLEREVMTQLQLDSWEGVELDFTDLSDIQISASKIEKA